MFAKSNSWLNYIRISSNRTSRRRINGNVCYSIVSSSIRSLPPGSIVTSKGLWCNGRCSGSASRPRDSGRIRKGGTKGSGGGGMGRFQSLEKVAVEEVMVALHSVNVALMASVSGEKTF